MFVVIEHTYRVGGLLDMDMLAIEGPNGVTEIPLSSKLLSQDMPLFGGCWKYHHLASILGHDCITDLLDEL